MPDPMMYFRVFKACLVRLQLQLRRQVRIQEWRKRGVEISESAIINLGPHAVLEIGAGSSIGAYTLLDLTDDPNHVRGGDVVASRLAIGERTAINEFNNIRGAGGSIEIGDNCLISQFVSIIASNHSVDVPGVIRDIPWDTESNWVKIEDEVWIGTHAVILPGVKIGKASVVAAGAVVTRDVPDYAIVAGIPAEVRRLRNLVEAQIICS